MPVFHYMCGECGGENDVLVANIRVNVVCPKCRRPCVRVFTPTGNIRVPEYFTRVSPRADLVPKKGEDWQKKIWPAAGLKPK